MLRIAVLGCGRIGRMHAANVAAHPRAKLASVYDTHRPFAEEVAARSGITAADSADAIFASGDIDAVLACCLMCGCTERSLSLVAAVAEPVGLWATRQRRPSDP